MVPPSVPKGRFVRSRCVRTATRTGWLACNSQRKGAPSSSLTPGGEKEKARGREELHARVLLAAWLPLSTPLLLLLLSGSAVQQGRKRRRRERGLGPPPPPPLELRANGRPPALARGRKREEERGTKNCGASTKQGRNVSWGRGRGGEGRAPPADTSLFPQHVCPRSNKQATPSF